MLPLVVVSCLIVNMGERLDLCVVVVFDLAGSRCVIWLACRELCCCERLLCLLFVVDATGGNRRETSVSVWG